MIVLTSTDSDTQRASIAGSTHLQGAKLALILGTDLIAYLRDDITSIPDPNFWDLPGGIREHGETALACALREAKEEFGIAVSPSALRYASIYRAEADGGLPARDVAFFVAEISQAEVEAIVFGKEGQYWRMMPVTEFIDREDAVLRLRESLAAWWSKRS